MWTASASLSGISLENHVWSWVCGYSTTATPTLKFPLLVLYEPGEPHPDERNAIDGVASSKLEKGLHNLNFSLTRVLLHSKYYNQCFHWNQYWGGCGEGSTKKTNPKMNSRLPMLMERDDCPWCDCQGERLPSCFPECTGEFGIEEQWPKIPVTWTVRKKSQSWVTDLRGGVGPKLYLWFSSLSNNNTTQVDQTLRENDEERWRLLMKLTFCQCQHWLQCHKNLGLKQPCSLPFPTAFSKTHIFFLSVWKCLKHGDLLKK